MEPVSALIVNNIPVNGIDVSHWNGESTEPVPPWVQFYGMKAVHIGGSKMVDGVDPLFNYNRHRAAQTPSVRWAGMYLYLTHTVRQVDQINKLIETVGDLTDGEFIFLDWEDQLVTTLDLEALYYLNAIYGGRWAMYVNDMTASMTAWMVNNRSAGSPIPIIHPDWRLNGWEAAKKWDAAVWQPGVACVPGYAAAIDVDLVIKPDVLDRITR